MFKKKTWTEVKRHYSPPTNTLGPLKTNGAVDPKIMKFINRDRFGFTVIELCCDQTGELKFYEEYGDLT